MIRFRDVTKHYPRSGTALGEVSFHVRKGEFVFLTGPSGAGKTTVLRLVHMEIAPTRGDVMVSRFSSSRIRRREIPQLRRRVGFVFQDFRLLERFTARQLEAEQWAAVNLARGQVYGLLGEGQAAQDTVMQGLCSRWRSTIFLG